MKALFVILCLAAGLGGGAVGALVVGDSASKSGDESVSLVPDHVDAGPAADAEARAEIQALRLDLASLRSSMDAMRGQLSRESVVSEVVAANSNRIVVAALYPQYSEAAAGSLLAALVVVQTFVGGTSLVL